MDHLSSLAARDQKVLWHPYSQHGLHQDILPVVSGSGSYLTLENGHRVLDAISSWWVNIHGHAHPSMVAAITEQASKLEQVIFAGFTHEPAIELAEILIQAAAPLGKVSRCFFSDNGSTSVEVALKMAFQYHFNLKDFKRQKFLALRGSYHGDTLGAMAVGEPEGFHQLFHSLLPKVEFIEPDDFETLETILSNRGHEFAAFIYEPLLQGASGMRLYSVEFLKRLTELCAKHGVLTIADEVFTGFYRTGKCFAFQHAPLSPDLICVSKGITGGFLPLSATLCTETIFSAFLSQEIKTAFLHGHSYTANPIACAAALASWKLLTSDPCQVRIQEITRISAGHIERLKNHPGLKDARNLGTVGAIELKKDLNYFSSGKQKMIEHALNRGVLLRPLGNVIYTVPPYSVTNEELNLIYTVMEEIANEHI